MNRNLPSRKEKAKGLWHSMQKTGRAWAKTELPNSVCVCLTGRSSGHGSKGREAGARQPRGRAVKRRVGVGRLGEGRAA